MGPGDPTHPVRSGSSAPLTAFVDTNVLVRHLTGDPADLGARATADLRSTRELLLTDLAAAETVYVLESFYEAPRSEVATALRALVAFESIERIEPPPR